jgi:cytochrome P450
MEEVVYGIINERRRSGEQKPDLLGMLMEAKGEETGEGMPNRQLRDEVLTLMVAGHETTSVLLSWLFFLLDRHPKVRERLEAEVEQVLAGRTPTFDASRSSTRRCVYAPRPTFSPIGYSRPTQFAGTSSKKWG